MATSKWHVDPGNPHDLLNSDAQGGSRSTQVQLSSVVLYLLSCGQAIRAVGSAIKSGTNTPASGPLKLTAQPEGSAKLSAGRLVLFPWRSGIRASLSLASKADMADNSLGEPCTASWVRDLAVDESGHHGDSVGRLPLCNLLRRHIGHAQQVVRGRLASLLCRAGDQREHVCAST